MLQNFQKNNFNFQKLLIKTHTQAQRVDDFLKTY
jgi:hypothetical protein